MWLQRSGCAERRKNLLQCSIPRNPGFHAESGTSKTAVRTLRGEAAECLLAAGSESSQVRGLQAGPAALLKQMHNPKSLLLQSSRCDLPAAVVEVPIGGCTEPSFESEGLSSEIVVVGPSNELCRHQRRATTTNLRCRPNNGAGVVSGDWVGEW